MLKNTVHYDSTWEIKKIDLKYPITQVTWKCLLDDLLNIK